MIVIRARVWSKRGKYKQYFMTVPKVFAEKFGDNFNVNIIVLNKVLVVFVGSRDDAINELKSYIEVVEK